jgi:hypothetical protein
VGKENVAVTFENLIEHNAGVRPANQFCQSALALLDWHTAQIFAVEFDQVKSDQHRVVTVALVANQIEHRKTTVVGDDGLAVEQERVGGQGCDRGGGEREGRGKVVSLPGEQSPASSRRAMMRKPSCLIS